MHEDIETALERRRRLITEAFDTGDLSRTDGQAVGTKAAKAVKQRHLSPLLTARIFIWEPVAVENLNRFWSSENNQKVFARQCLDENGEARIVEKLLNPAFHYFPCGDLFPDNCVPTEYRDPECEKIFPPVLDALAIAPVQSDDFLMIPCMYDVLYLKPGTVSTVAKRLRVIEGLKATPHRQLPNVRDIGGFAHTEWIATKGGEIAYGRHLLRWVALAYRLRIFLETDYPAIRTSRVSKGQSTKAGSPRNEDYSVIHLRKAVPAIVRGYRLPEISRVTHWKLGFEVFVRGHIRRCHSGKITTVRPHKKGPPVKNPKDEITVVSR